LWESAAPRARIARTLVVSMNAPPPTMRTSSAARSATRSRKLGCETSGRSRGDIQEGALIEVERGRELELVGRDVCLGEPEPSPQEREARWACLLAGSAEGHRGERRAGQHHAPGLRHHVLSEHAPDVDERGAERHVVAAGLHPRHVVRRRLDDRGEIVPDRARATAHDLDRVADRVVVGERLQVVESVVELTVGLLLVARERVVTEGHPRGRARCPSVTVGAETSRFALRPPAGEPGLRGAEALAEAAQRGEEGGRRAPARARRGAPL
jgi:hypothetical protein